MVVCGERWVGGVRRLEGSRSRCRAGHSAFSSSQGTNQQQHQSTFGQISARDRVIELKTIRGCESVSLSIEVSIPVTENLPKQLSDVAQT